MMMLRGRRSYQDSEICVFDDLHRVNMEARAELDLVSRGTTVDASWGRERL